MQATSTKNQKLTTEQLRNYPGFKHLTEDEAAAFIETAEQLSIIAYSLYREQLEPEEP